MTNIDPISYRFNMDVIDSIKRLDELFNSKIIDSEMRLIYRRSVFIEILILMKDLLIKADKKGKRISFKDDIISKDNPRGKIEDVTDLVSNFRDAACHIDSPRHEVEASLLSFSEVRGKKPNAYVINDLMIGSDYDDEIAFIMGANRMYFKRHLERAFAEIKQLFSPIIQNPRIPFNN